MMPVNSVRKHVCPSNPVGNDRFLAKVFQFSFCQQVIDPMSSLHKVGRCAILPCAQHRRGREGGADQGQT